MNKLVILAVAALLLLSPGILIPQALASHADGYAVPLIHTVSPASSTVVGLTPSQIRHAYGFDLLSCASSNTCGSGQTIAIVDAFNDPNIQSDLNTFDSQFGLPACTTSNGCFTIATPQGPPRTNRGWAHAIAPGAKILPVEVATNSSANLFGAVDYASARANQVSMSWGGTDASSDSSNDSHFAVSGVTFFASSGDNGHGLIYPSTSPLVVSVGGTTLTLGSGGNVVSETAWSGSGGGISAFENEPSYQTNYPIPNTGGLRGNPDVSYDADPASGVAVFDSLGDQGFKNWIQVGGTSAGSPQWAALNAIANVGRASPLSSTPTTTPTNLAIYNIAQTAYSTNLRDITPGTNGRCGSVCTAGTNYDFVTGLRSPRANVLVPSLQKA